MAWFNRRRQNDALEEAETAQAMTDLAATFLAGAAEEGWIFGWERSDAGRCDELCDAFLLSDPTADVRHRMVMSMGAYVGELLVRLGDGKWTYDAPAKRAQVELANGIVGWPHDKVAKRLNLGPQHSLAQYVHYALTRDPGPDAVITER